MKAWILMITQSPLFARKVLRHWEKWIVLKQLGKDVLKHLPQVCHSLKAAPYREHGISATIPQVLSRPFPRTSIAKPGYVNVFVRHITQANIEVQVNKNRKVFSHESSL